MQTNEGEEEYEEELRKRGIPQWYADEKQCPDDLNKLAKDYKEEKKGKCNTCSSKSKKWHEEPCADCKWNEFRYFKLTPKDNYKEVE